MLCPGWECSQCDLEQLSEQLQQVEKDFCTILVSRHLLIPGNAEKLVFRLQEVYVMWRWKHGFSSTQELPFWEDSSAVCWDSWNSCSSLFITEKGWELCWDHEALRVFLHCSISSQLVCCSQHKLHSHRRAPQSAVIQKVGSRRSCWCLANAPPATNTSPLILTQGHSIWALPLWVWWKILQWVTGKESVERLSNAQLVFVMQANFRFSTWNVIRWCNCSNLRLRGRNLRMS